MANYRMTWTDYDPDMRITVPEGAELTNAVEDGEYVYGDYQGNEVVVLAERAELVA